MKNTGLNSMECGADGNDSVFVVSTGKVKAILRKKSKRRVKMAFATYTSWCSICGREIRSNDHIPDLCAVCAKRPATFITDDQPNSQIRIKKNFKEREADAQLMVELMRKRAG
jgi:hypothetical protein